MKLFLFGIALILCGLISIAASIIADTTPAKSHSWYDPACCSDWDCAPIPASAVQLSKDGFQVTLAPSDHPMVTKPRTWLVSYNSAQIRESQDSDYHACIGQSSQRMICLYVPNMGA